MTLPATPPPLLKNAGFIVPLNHSQSIKPFKSFSLPLLQSSFRAWLTEKEGALNEVQTSNFKDPSEMNTNVRQLAVGRVTFLSLSWQVP